MKNKSELKAALDALQVKKPLRLPSSSAPSFAAPQSRPTIAHDKDKAPVEIPTQVPQETEVENRTQVDQSTVVRNEAQVRDPSMVENQTSAAQTTLARNGTQVVQTTQVENKTEVQLLTEVNKPTEVLNPTQVGTHAQVADATSVGIPTPVVMDTTVENVTPVEKLTQVGNPTKVRAAGANALVQSRRACEQDSSVMMESRAVDNLEKGFTRLPNCILMRLASGDYTRNEIKLALLIARFTISYQRKQAPLSKAVLERRSGLRGAAVLEALSGLTGKGLVEKQQGDQNRPNQLGLILPEDWEDPTKPDRPKDGTPAEKPTSVVNATQVPNAPNAGVGNPTSAPVGKATYFKDIKIYPKKNSLSELPEALRKYFDELKPAKKRESEWRAFQELQGDYSASDITECFELIYKQGIGKGDDTQQCHSPMAFLSKAISGIMAEVEKLRQKTKERAERHFREAEAKRKQIEDEARESAEWAAKERAFEKAFSDETRQHEVLSELLANLPFRPNTQAGRIMAIGRWWDGLNAYERQELTGG